MTEQRMEVVGMQAEVEEVYGSGNKSRSDWNQGVTGSISTNGPHENNTKLSSLGRKMGEDERNMSSGMKQQNYGYGPQETERNSQQNNFEKTGAQGSVKTPLGTGGDCLASHKTDCIVLDRKELWQYTSFLTTDMTSRKGVMDTQGKKGGKGN